MAKEKLTARGVEAVKPPTREQRQIEIWDTVTPGLSLRVGFGGTKAFYLTVKIDGRNRRIKLGTTSDITLAEARARAGEVRADARKGVTPKEREAEARRKAERARRNTFEAIANDFIEEKAKRDAPRSWKELRRKIDRDLIPEWGKKPIASIDRDDVRKLIRRKARKSPISANRLLTLVKQIFMFAIEEDKLETSPAIGIKPEPETPRERVLTDDEIKKVWRAFDAEGYPYGPLFKMLLLTAQRRTEVAGMKRSEIEGDGWRLPGSRSKRGVGHLVPLSPLALKIIENLPRVGDHLFSSGQRIDSEGKTTDRPVVAFRKAKARCDKRSNVKDWRLHDLRRTAATYMRELEVDRLTVSKVLNHAESGVTQVYDRYGADSEKRNALNKWSKRIRNMVEEGN